MAEVNKEKAEGKKGLPFIAKVLIIAIVLILIVVMSVGSAFFIASKVNKSSSEETNTVEVKKEKSESGSGEEETSFGTIIEFGEYTVNLNEPEPRYLVVKINFELNPELKEKELTEITESTETKKVIIQDRVLSILRSKSITDLQADIENVALKKELTDEVNKIMGEEVVKTVRFNNWLIQ